MAQPTQVLIRMIDQRLKLLPKWLNYCRIRVKRLVPRPIRFLYTLVRCPRDIPAVVAFLCEPNLKLPLRQRLQLIKQLYVISYHVNCSHTQEEILRFVKAILLMPEDVRGCIVEAGCYKGGSTAKFSIAAKVAKRELIVFDSFEGIPENTEPHERDIWGEPAKFKQGDYWGSLEEVKANVKSFGCIEVCRFIKGWFEDTMPDFHEPVAAIYLDVDLASSTRTCVKYLYPLLAPGMALFSHDGHLPLVIDVFDDDEFWRTEVGCRKPSVTGLREKALIMMTKRL